MNATVTRDDEIAHYTAAVEDALSDLPPQVRADLVVDLVDHLTEIAGETTEGVPLAARLGPPERYAAELRSTLDGPVAHPEARYAEAPPKPSDDLRRLGERFNAFTGTVTGYAKGTDFLRALLPGWWIVRALVIAQVLLAMMLGGSGYGARVYGSPLLIAVLAWHLGAIVVSVRIGRSESRATWWAGLLVNVLGGLALWNLTMILLIWAGYY